MFQNMTIKEFLEKTASNSPVPGGGSVAALSGALACALTEMVANLTIGKKGYEDVNEDMEKIVFNMEQLRIKLLKDIERDSEAFNRVMEAFKLPKNTDEEISKRKTAIQEGLKEAALVPLEVAKDTFKMMDLINVAVEKGNKNAITDGAVSAMMARTAILSALYNVKINLLSIKDEKFVGEVSGEVEMMESQVKKLEEEILSKVKL